jgi:hypothetical protein
MMYVLYMIIFDLFWYYLSNRSKNMKFFFGILMYSFMVNVFVLRLYKFSAKFPYYKIMQCACTDMFLEFICIGVYRRVRRHTLKGLSHEMDLDFDDMYG